MKNHKFANPFYFLLIVVGVAFFVSACAYGVMAFRDVSFRGEVEPQQAGLMAFMDRHGGKVLGAEVALLGLFTVGAIRTDEYWQRRESEEEHVTTTAEKDRDKATLA